jgi:hypothetical protein
MSRIDIADHGGCGEAFCRRPGSRAAHILPECVDDYVGEDNRFVSLRPLSTSWIWQRWVLRVLKVPERTILTSKSAGIMRVWSFFIDRF